MNKKDDDYATEDIDPETEMQDLTAVGKGEGP